MDNMTAKVSCFARAYHYKNNSIHIFSDNIAEALYGYHEWKLCPNTFPLQVMGCRRKGTYIICF